MSSRGKKKDLKHGHGYLLDAWLPPADAGELIGCVATSFTFQPAFFVEECLGRCLGMTSDAEDDGLAHLIELEEKLAQARCLALVDQAHAHGTHTLRWDLLSARVPGGILHAKVSVLVWAAHVRVIVASANLTEPGYRSNREIFGVLNYYEGGTAPLSVLHELLSFLAQTARQCVEPSSARERWADVLKLARIKAQSWGSEQPGMVRAVLSGLGQADTLTQLSKDVWPLKRPPTFARVGSPFFDLNPGDNAPARRLWELLDQRIAEVQWEVAGRIESAKPPVVYLKLPGTIRNAQPTGSSQTFFVSWQTTMKVRNRANFMQSGCGWKMRIWRFISSARPISPVRAWG